LEGGVKKPLSKMERGWGEVSELYLEPTEDSLSLNLEYFLELL
jgi:hypothetical protein